MSYFILKMKYILYKDIGMTSNDFAYQCKISLNTKRLCYVGRLDPMAKGDMIILTDDDVKDMDKYIGNNKTYRFDIIIGLSTVSGDIASEIVNTHYIPNNDTMLMNTIEDKISTFIKTYTIQKYHPISSYMYRHGNIRKPLWWYTQNNIQIDSIPQKRVDIHTHTIYTKKYIPVQDFNEHVKTRLHTIKNSKTREDLKIEKVMDFYNNVDNNRIQNSRYMSVEMEMSVSSGFYIRQFCVDFGEYIGYPCIAMDINRISI